MNMEELREGLFLYDLLKRAEDAAAEAAEHLELMDKKKEFLGIQANMTDALICLNLAINNFKIKGVN